MSSLMKGVQRRLDPVFLYQDVIGVEGRNRKNRDRPIRERLNKGRKDASLAEWKRPDQLETCPAAFVLNAFRNLCGRTDDRDFVGCRCNREEAAFESPRRHGRGGRHTADDERSGDLRELK